MVLSRGCWRDSVSGHPHLQIDLIERVLQGIRVVFLIVLVVLLLWRDTKPGRVRAHRPRGQAAPTRLRAGVHKPTGHSRGAPLLVPASMLTVFTRGKNIGQELARQAVLLVVVVLLLVVPHVAGVICTGPRSSCSTRTRPPPTPRPAGTQKPRGPVAEDQARSPHRVRLGKLSVLVGRERAERLCGTTGAGSAGLLATPEVLQADPGDQPGPSGTLTASRRSASPGPGCQPSLQGGRAPWLHSAGAAWRAALASVTLDSSLMISFRILTSRGTLVQRSGSGRRRRLHVPRSLGRCPARQCATHPLHCPARTQP